MKVTIEREHWVRKTVNGYRALHREWIPGWTGEVLYADRQYILVRSAGSHQTFRGIPAKPSKKGPRSCPAEHLREGGVEANMWGYDPKHRDIVKLGLGKDRWGRLQMGRIRISPKSAEEMRLAMKAGGLPFLVRTHQSVERRHRVVLRRPGHVRIAKDYHHETYHEGKARESREAALRAGKKKACKPNKPLRRAR